VGLGHVWARLVREHRLAFGREPAWSSILLDIRTGPTPPAPLTGTPCPVQLRRGWHLRHSELYGRPEFFEKLRTWLDGRLDVDGPARATRPNRKAWLGPAIAGLVVLLAGMCAQSSV